MDDAIKGVDCAICGKEMEGCGNAELHCQLHHPELVDPATVLNIQQEHGDG